MRLPPLKPIKNTISQVFLYLPHLCAQLVQVDIDAVARGASLGMIGWPANPQK